MNCWQCGKENPDDATICQNCNSPLSEQTQAGPKTSKLVKRIFVATTIILLIILAVLIHGLTRPRCTARKIPCATNMAAIDKAILLYAKDHNDTFPPAENWCDILIENYNVNPKTFHCPESNAKKGQSSYAYNINVAGKKVSEVPPDVVLLFETTPDTNPAGGPELLSTENHQGDGCNISYVDQHVYFEKDPKPPYLRWTVGDVEN
ncbi:MAG: hypothetical protein JW806_09180 [Sedimentisphaerales bacterium]|nr:hypothetical protein [Sedimentisphaerales bacterium]